MQIFLFSFFWIVIVYDLFLISGAKIVAFSIGNHQASLFSFRFVATVTRSRDKWQKALLNLSRALGKSLPGHLFFLHRFFLIWRWKRDDSSSVASPISEFLPFDDTLGQFRWYFGLLPMILWVVSDEVSQGFWSLEALLLMIFWPENDSKHRCRESWFFVIVLVSRL